MFIDFKSTKAPFLNKPGSMYAITQKIPDAEYNKQKTSFE